MATSGGTNFATPHSVMFETTWIWVLTCLDLDLVSSSIHQMFESRKSLQLSLESLQQVGRVLRAHLPMINKPPILPQMAGIRMCTPSTCGWCICVLLTL